jgi:S1-C subfamily serine protease
MRFLKAAALAATTALAGTAHSATLENVAASTYKIFADGRGACSGVAVSDTKILTATHCLAGQMSIQIPVLDGDLDVVAIDVRSLRVVRNFKDTDVALLELRHGTFPSVLEDFGSPNDAQMTIGDSVATVGYPMVEDLTVHVGQYTGRTRAPQHLGLKTQTYKTTIPVTGGNSGCGLYRVVDSDFRLIGVTSFMNTRVSFMSYFMPYENMQAVLRNFVPMGTQVASASNAEGELVSSPRVGWEHNGKPLDQR